MAKLDPKRTVALRKEPSQRRSVATVGIILDAAAHILEEHGLGGYTTNSIAERAGVSIGSCYQYFPSKEAIAVALASRETAQISRGLEVAREADSWEEGIELAIAAAVAHQLRRPRLALQLDLAEDVLMLGAEHASVQAQAQVVITTLLGLGDAPAVTDVEQASRDLVAIAHGMIDGAGRHGETDAELLGRRVRQAISGYLVACG
jgi:AcrR family transcriptional regulator